MSMNSIILLCCCYVYLVCGYNWLQFNGNSSHTGINNQETIINASTVSSLTKLFKVQLPAKMDGTSVIVEKVKTQNGTIDMLFVTSVEGDIVAIDANMGNIIWANKHGAGDCHVMNETSEGPCFSTSSPVVDSSLSYIYTYGLDGYIHKHHLANGSEVTVGWPQITTRKPYFEKCSSSLSLVDAGDGYSYLYATHSAYPGTDDGGDFQGHVTIINLDKDSQVVYNGLCSNITTHLRNSPEIDCPEVRAGIWGRSGVVYSPITDRIYFTSGNGAFNMTHHHWGDTIISLPPSGIVSGGNPIDAYTPSDYMELEEHDLDLGSTSVALINVPGRHIGIQGGKDQQVRLVDLENLSGRNGIGYIGGELAVYPVPDYGMVFSTPVSLFDSSSSLTYVFVASMSGLSALGIRPLSNGSFSFDVMWKNSCFGSSPLLVNDVLFFAYSNNIQALNPLTGDILWTSTDIGDVHWQVPVVANGVLYIGDESGALHAYHMPS